jgi:hypothetical protein
LQPQRQLERFYQSIKVEDNILFSKLPTSAFQGVANFYNPGVVTNNRRI